mmetsp:Transcript_31149/g.103068  ORF Transcript_31149/g.103068 Transcript_31149/m.103068 type:complete len:250 (-) Transcript_31149:519-1268(-)
MPSCSAALPTMKPVIFCTKRSGMPRCAHSCTKWAPFCADSEKSTPSFATTPTRYPCTDPNPVISVEPYSALNSLSSDPSSTRASTRRIGSGWRESAGTKPRSSAGSKSGGRASARGSDPPCEGGSEATIWRASLSPCGSSSAKWSVTPEVLQCTSAPPSSSAVTSSPVAALTSGGPPRKMVPLPRTITASSAIAGTYAPPAVQLPQTSASCGTPAADILAWLKKMRPKCSLSGKTSACRGRLAPPESTR